jgi:ATPase subunit of ABC transporter with duplicated ATPase domains
LFSGGWAAFVREREVAAERAQQRYDEYAAQRQALVDRGQRQREWVAKGAGRVRRSDESDKFIRHHQLDQTEKLAGKAARTERAIERLDVVDEPRSPWELRYDIPTASRSGDIVWTGQGVTFERDGFVLGPVDLDIAAGDRIAILGPNGAGKTTLLDLLLGRLEPTSGRASIGASVLIGEVEQARTDIVGDAGLLEAFCTSTGLSVVEARSLLAKFALGPDHLDRPGSTLSPGERTRASLAVLMANGANLLVVDEPTNHLDLEAIEQLERALDRFAGTLLLVTHDRALLAATRVDRVLFVERGAVTEIDLDDGAARRACVAPDHRA